ncbi:P-loop containing nucleoside triphosphate hydrolase protein [Dioszegia hungarica]|uniref:RNA helicase n=1 Tax=Dioszegia hungarica TaxID=4972 RepID=A0AA38LRC4_9TREE|nr:P-loop containing nucleoside triphosphate hydrolase protein [Dioszegia hungarica]KAI9632805.1 P-loop containing nucleoside triphosphate hydrolase protein [Dioszegia hungarica]
MRGGSLSSLAQANTLASSSKPKKGNKRARIASSAASTSDAPKAKKDRLTAESLQWRTLNPASFSGFDDGGGMMMLEELDDVGVEWETAEGGMKVARFVAAEGKKGKGKAKAVEPAVVDEEEVWGGIPDDAVPEADEAEGSGSEDGADLPEFSRVEKEDLDEEDEEETEAAEPFDDALLPAWSEISLHPRIKRALLALGFVSPTGIQGRALPSGLSGRDVVGVAETGSGKTLAYSLPILSHLLLSPTPSKSTRRPLSALIVCPTRELALQVVDHLQKVVAHLMDDEERAQAKKHNKPPRVSIGSVIGGLSAHKQKRIVDRGADILVATPGRLWDLIKSDEDLATGVRTLKFLIIDEADRMIENGHFAELENIVRLTQRQGASTAGPDDDDPVFAAANSDSAPESRPREDMQTFVFSATLSKDLQQNLKRKQRKPKNGTKRASALEDLVDRLDFRDANPEVIDLSPEGGVVATLRESMVECVVTDKDLYLYYFLLRYPGRTMVFTGSIDGIRRLIPLFEMLQMPVYPLHSQLQQKQRLKNLDRFKEAKSAVLIATDVASRGLDIPNVDHVVHFNLPRTADAYIHRSGRTARAQNPGFALQIVSAEERGMQRSLMRSLGRTVELPELPIESGFLPKLKERLRVAQAIEKAQHEVKKETHDRNWLKEAAEAMDIDLDDDMLDDGELTFDRPHIRPQHRRKGNRTESVANLKAELKHLMKEPLVARGVSARYPTGGSKVIIDDLVRASGHETLLGAPTAKAWDEPQKKGKKIVSGNKRKRPAATAAAA